MPVESERSASALSRVSYRNCRTAAVLYSVERARLTGLLPHSLGLLPVGFREHALVHVAWFDYPESSIGSYRELSVGVLASTAPISGRALLPLLTGEAGQFGSWVLALPVDSAEACTAGIERCGLPKTLATFVLDWSKRAVSAELFEDGSRALRMQIPLGFGVPLPIRELKLFTEMDGRLAITAVSTQWTAWLDFVGRSRLTLGPGTGRLAQLLETLGLEQAKPLAILHGRIGLAELTPPGGR